MSIRPSTLLFILGATACQVATAQSELFKCRADGATLYQNAPCGTDPHIVTASPAAQGPPAAASGAGATTPAFVPPKPHDPRDRPSLVSNADLVVGMSDTVVLNRPQWGRPHKIARLRASDGFREEWKYVSRTDGSARILRFLNGKLTAMDYESAPSIAGSPSTPTLASARPAPRQWRNVTDPPPAEAPAATAAANSPVAQAQVGAPGHSADEAMKVLERSALLGIAPSAIP